MQVVQVDELMRVAHLKTEADGHLWLKQNGSEIWQHVGDVIDLETESADVTEAQGAPVSVLAFRRWVSEWEAVDGD